MNDIIFVGLDADKATISVAIAEGVRGGEVRELGKFLNRPDHIEKLVERLAKGGRFLSFCYEACRMDTAFIVSSSPLAANAGWRRRRSFR
jgi:hypothetical protein